MKSIPLRSSRRAAAWVGASLLVCWMVGCGNDGGVGDGTTDDGIPPAGASSVAGAKGGKAGAPSASAGAIGQSGAPGSAGTSESAGTSGSAGFGAASGSVGMSGNGSGGTSGGAGSGTSGSAGKAGTAGANNGGGTSGAGASGAGASGGGAPSAGAPGAGAGGAPSLTCGNGTVETGETCDDGLANSSSGGMGGNGGSGGDAPTAKPGELCSNTCFKVSTQACVDCEVGGDCFESVDNCLGVSAPFSTLQQTQCYSVMHCIQQSNCLDGTGTLGKCYCGSLSTAACGAAPFTGAGSPDGACIKEIQTGFPTFTSNSAVLGGLTASDFPAGAAMKRLSCQKGASESQCLDVCGFSAGGPVFP